MTFTFVASMDDVLRLALLPSASMASPVLADQPAPRVPEIPVSDGNRVTSPTPLL
jgi:hypothetical protein